MFDWGASNNKEWLWCVIHVSVCWQLKLNAATMTEYHKSSVYFGHEFKRFNTWWNDLDIYIFQIAWLMLMKNNRKMTLNRICNTSILILYNNQGTFFVLLCNFFFCTKIQHNSDLLVEYPFIQIQKTKRNTHLCCLQSVNNSAYIHFIQSYIFIISLFSKTVHHSPVTVHMNNKSLSSPSQPISLAF